jgi:hypothetical protein
MKRIIIDVSKGELDFMREALETKHINMMSYLDTCENEARQPEWNQPLDLTEKEFMDQVEIIKKEAKEFVYTPKKTRGRPRKGTPK